MKQPEDSDNLPDASEIVWMDVIHKMDETYENLVRHQVELERKNTELEEVQTFIASVQSSMTDVMIVCDAEGCIQQVNRSLEALTGRSAADWTGQPLSALFAPSSKKLADSFRELLLKQTVYDCEVSMVGREEAVPLSLNCSTRFDHRRRPVGAVLIGRPVGELRKAYEALNQAHDQLKQAQKSLVQAEKMASLGRLVAGVAHELNNPISFVYGNVHVLQGYVRKLDRYLATVHGEGLGEAQEELRRQLRIDNVLKDLEPLMEGTLEGSERVRDIVEDLRRFSSGQKAMNASFDFAHVIRTAMHWVLKGARQDIRTEIELPDDFHSTGHAGQMHQVVMNLVQNAVDATAELGAPHIRVCGGQDGKRLWLEVHDNGPGVSAEDRERVFDPFFTHKPVGQGTGLGLSISYGIVAEHRGTLRVGDSPLGGALFRIELPLGDGA
ncbi:MAG: ATP-binding protein [Acidihalobacter sp.]|uniref:PAS domain-containing sensor histidine kinase n=1 Tax=Acidihalobacter sp. TaxID=1872108 RepID=UPI00307F47DD